MAGTFKAQEVTNTLWAYATIGREPGAAVMKELEGRAEAVAGTFKAQGMANTLWAGMMRELEGRAEAVAGTFNAQDVANKLWAVGGLALLCAPGQVRRWLQFLVHVLQLLQLVQRLATLGKAACFNTLQLCQVHQSFVSCSVEPRLRMEAINDMRALKETCREAFVFAKAAPSATQQQVSETLRHMGMLVEDEVRCPKSGYSIDMMVHDSGRGMGGERSSSTGTWAVEFDGPSHFLTSRAPTGATLLKRRHLLGMGHTLVSVPYWEWERCQGAGEREQAGSNNVTAACHTLAEVASLTIAFRTP